jgi:acetyl-CoA C-acetyltransferase
MRKVAVAGLGLIKVKEHWETPIQDLFAKAAFKALDDAGNPDIEALYVSNMSGELFQNQLNLGTVLVDAIGKTGISTTRIEAGSASGGVAFHEAVKAVASGYCDYVLVGGVEKMSDVLPSMVTTSLLMSEDQEYTAYTGITKSGLSALIHRLYLDRYATPEEIGMMAVRSHDNAVGCKHAQYPFKMSIERAMASPMEADPIHMMECAGIGDGAAAIVLFPADKEGVEVAASSVASDTNSITNRADLLSFKSVKIAAEKAYKMAGINPSDIDVVEIQDDYSINGVVSLESLGFVEKGKGAKFVSEGGTSREGKIPTNTFGGLKARGNPLGATGIYQIAEIILQLFGRAGDHQIKGAKLGMAQNMGGIGSICSVNIFRRLKE